MQADARLGFTGQNGRSPDFKTWVSTTDSYSGPADASAMRCAAGVRCRRVVGPRPHDRRHWPRKLLRGDTSLRAAARPRYAKKRTQCNVSFKLLYWQAIAVRCRAGASEFSEPARRAVARATPLVRRTQVTSARIDTANQRQQACEGRCAVRVRAVAAPSEAVLLQGSDESVRNLTVHARGARRPARGRALARAGIGRYSAARTAPAVTTPQLDHTAAVPHCAQRPFGGKAAI